MVIGALWVNVCHRLEYAMDIWNVVMVVMKETVGDIIRPLKANLNVQTLIFVFKYK